jgi:hypothetical protein
VRRLELDAASSILSGVQYIGADVVPSLIASNREQFTRPGVHFIIADLTKDPPPRADLVLCRDCLVHLSLRIAQQCWRTFDGSIQRGCWPSWRG